MAMTVNSTNVRNILSLTWQRLALGTAAAFAPDAAIERAMRLFSTPPRFPASPAARQALAAGERFEVREGALSLMAWRYGRQDAPAVLLSHGWGGRGVQLRAFIAPLVEAGYQPVLFDHVGHGESGGVGSTIVHFADGLEAVTRRLERRGVRIAGLVGHSLGAAAAAAWLNDSGRELRAVLIAPPASLVRASSQFARRLGLPETIRRGMQQRFERAFGRPWADYELPGSLVNVRAQALVIHDALDREVPRAAGEALARAWPGAGFVATRGLGHHRILREPAVARDAVDFINGRVRFAAPSGAPAPLY